MYAADMAVYARQMYAVGSVKEHLLPLLLRHQPLDIANILA